MSVNRLFTEIPTNTRQITHLTHGETYVFRYTNDTKAEILRVLV